VVLFLIKLHCATTVEYACALVHYSWAESCTSACCLHWVWCDVNFIGLVKLPLSCSLWFQCLCNSYTNDKKHLNMLMVGHASKDYPLLYKLLCIKHKWIITIYMSVSHHSYTLNKITLQCFAGLHDAFRLYLKFLL